MTTPHRRPIPVAFALALVAAFAACGSDDAEVTNASTAPPATSTDAAPAADADPPAPDTAGAGGPTPATAPAATTADGPGGGGAVTAAPSPTAPATRETASACDAALATSLTAWFGEIATQGYAPVGSTDGTAGCQLSPTDPNRIVSIGVEFVDSATFAAMAGSDPSLFGIGYVLIPLDDLGPDAFWLGVAPDDPATLTASRNGLIGARSGDRAITLSWAGGEGEDFGAIARELQAILAAS